MSDSQTSHRGNSRSITTNQLGPHEKVPELVRRHLNNVSQKPFNQHTLDAFTQVTMWLNERDPDRQKPLILDSCCGVGESTANIAAQHPEALIIGIDKSQVRTLKHAHYSEQADNYQVIRADVNDFWRLANQHNWRLEKHFLLYPNPYPKSAHVQRRWHACAAFKDIVALGGELEVRSNWDIYIQEMALALQTAGKNATIQHYQAEQALTPFERKYWASGQRSWRVVCDL
ncbi:SAM-dependent methyltransferase [Aliiglaciecola litoralis]|uniref:tRNA (guanine(46)-N(7))-methyltransferase n=1 Tax=Aliiglaciecola litoralis TaxID=582857 RepID=A0ABP3WPB0_9ALTE